MLKLVCPVPLRTSIKSVFTRSIMILSRPPPFNETRWISLKALVKSYTMKWRRLTLTLLIVLLWLVGFTTKIMPKRSVESHKCQIDPLKACLLLSSMNGQSVRFLRHNIWGLVYQRGGLQGAERRLRMLRATSKSLLYEEGMHKTSHLKVSPIGPYDYRAVVWR